MLLPRERRHGYGRNACEPQPVLADDVIQRLENLVAGAKIDVELHEGTTVEAGVDRESRSALRRLIEFKAGFTNVEDEKVSELHGCRDLEAFPQGCGQVFRRNLCAGSCSNGEIEILRRASPVEPHLERVSTFQHPTVMRRLARVEHARKKPVESDLAPYPMEINGVATRPFEQACFEGGP